MLDEMTYLKELCRDKVLLIVEDDPSILLSLKNILKHLFETIYTAQNVDEALSIYEEHFCSKIFLVITDINLGNKSGINLTYELKSHNKDQRVIAISGLEQSRVFMESIECGIDSFLLKPIGRNKLFKTLTSVLQKINYDQELQKNKQLLEDSKKYTVELLKEQDRFLKNAIHEIHTPLAIIIANIDLLRMQGIHNESLDAIEAGSRTIETSYEDMTYLMKHSRITTQKSDINLVDFIQERLRYFECIAVANGLDISLRVEDSALEDIHFSQLKLSRIVDNTLSNAIKYAYKPSKITVTIGLKSKKIFFEVHNHGVAIEDTQKIFERFYRESLSKGGYGLGLSIVSQICQECDVKVEISSNITQGTSFRYLF